MEFIKKVLGWKFWFSSQAYLSSTFIIIFIVVFLLLVAGIYFTTLYKKSKKDKEAGYILTLYEKISSVCYAGFISLLLLMFCSYEYIYFFNFRIWYVVWFVIMVWQGVNIFNYKNKKIPVYKIEQEEKSNFKKYFSKKKK